MPMSFFKMFFFFYKCDLIWQLLYIANAKCSWSLGNAAQPPRQAQPRPPPQAPWRRDPNDLTAYLPAPAPARAYAHARPPARVFPRARAPVHARARREREEGGGGRWACITCTFVNHPSMEICVMCEMPRVR